MQKMDCNTKEKPCSLNKIEHSSADTQPFYQMSSKSLYHGLGLEIHSVVELQI